MYLRTRKYKFVILTKYRDDFIKWKRESSANGQTTLIPHYELVLSILKTYFMGFDFLSVPAPSFHTYDNYPIYEAAKILSTDLGIPLNILFKNNSGRKNKGWLEARNKPIQQIILPKNSTVLIIDDIYTTGHTLRVTLEAIFKAGGVACGVALC